MRLLKGSTILTGLVISAFMLSGCTQDNSVPEPSPSATVSQEPTSTPTAPVVVPSQELEIEDNALTALPAPQGVDAPTFSAVRNAARGFAVAGVTNTDALSGTWTMAGLAEDFSQYASDDLTAQIGALDPANLDNSYTIMSLSPVLTPTEEMGALEGCTPSAEWTECLTQNIVFSEASATLDAPLNAVKFTFVVSTVRGLVVSGEAKQSPVKYTMNLWVDVTTHKVIAVDNDFSFAPAS